MGYSELSEYPSGITRMDCSATQAVFVASGVTARVAGFVLQSNGAAGAVTFTCTNQSGSVVYFQAIIGASDSLAIPLKFLTRDGLRFASAGYAGGTCFVTVFTQEEAVV